MFSYNNKISLRQFQILLVLYLLGTGIISVPSTSAKFAGQDGWIVILLSTMIALFMVIIITSLAKMFPNESFISYTSRIVTRPVASLISLVFVFKIVAGIALGLRTFSEIITELILPQTPIWLISATMLALGVFAATKGFETLARSGEIIIIIVIIPLLVVLAICLANVDFTNLMPVLSTPLKSVWQGGIANVAAFSGIEFIMLAVPFFSTTKRLRRRALTSVIIVGVFFIAFTIISIAQFGYLQTSRKMFPVIDLMDTIALPGSFIERQEGLMISFWIVSVFAVVSGGVFFSSRLLKDTLAAKKNLPSIVVCSVAILVLSILPKDLAAVGLYKQLLFSNLGWSYMLFLPLVLLVIAKIRKLGDTNEKNSIQ